MRSDWPSHRTWCLPPRLREGAGDYLVDTGFGGEVEEIDDVDAGGDDDLDAGGNVGEIGASRYAGDIHDETNGTTINMSERALSMLQWIPDRPERQALVRRCNAHQDNNPEEEARGEEIDDIDAVDNVEDNPDDLDAGGDDDVDAGERGLGQLQWIAAPELQIRTIRDNSGDGDVDIGGNIEDNPDDASGDDDIEWIAAPELQIRTIRDNSGDGDVDIGGNIEDNPDDAGGDDDIDAGGDAGEIFDETNATTTNMTEQALSMLQWAAETEPERQIQRIKSNLRHQ